MTFSRKIFISVFSTALVLGSLIIWAAYRCVSNQTVENYQSRYSVFAKVLGDALSTMDSNTERLMHNSAQLVSLRDSQDGLLTTEELQKIRDELSITHIFITDNKGNFVRSTNENPKLIPNIYSFCPKYKNLIDGTEKIAATPIIHPHPEPKPYKFLLIPNLKRNRLIEIGIRVDFIATTLSEALKSDSNLISMSLYEPNGTPFGRFNSGNIEFNGSKVQLPTSFPKVIDDKENFHFFTKVTSSHPQCCQCDVSGTSRNGEYYYVLESEVSKRELNAIQATTKNIFLILTFANIILVYLFSRLLSRKLVKNIENAVQKIRNIKTKGSLNERIKLEGNDEVTFLTNEFDRLLDSLEDSQKKIIEVETVHAKVQMAKEVAHNIRSPVIAIEMMLPMFSKVPINIQKVLRDSVKEIKSLTERLTKRAEACSNSDSKVILFSKFVESAIEQKKIEFSLKHNIVFNFASDESCYHSRVLVDPVEFRAVISNIINNSMESYSDAAGRININCTLIDESCSLTISDYGIGIPSPIISNLGSEVISTKPGGRGLGVYHAFKTLKSWGGGVTISSSVAQGTTVAIELPVYVEEQIFPSEVNL